MYKKRRGKIGVVLVLLLIIALLMGGFYFFISTYSIKKVYVEGNVHYTQEEIKEMVMNETFANNSLILSLKYRNKEEENIPFVDVMDVKVLSPDTIKIIVYEKALAGYVEFMDSYMYFDRDGYVVETSNVKTAGIPQIAGLEFGHVVLGEKLPVADGGVFEKIMTITKLLDKYELLVDRIYFQSDMDIVLYFGDVKVILGKDNQIEDKVMLLPTFLKELEGARGTLDLSGDVSQGMGISVFNHERKEESE